MNTAMRRVEYISTNGDCHFITNYVPTGTDIRILCKFYHIGYTSLSNWIAWYSARTSDSSENYRVIRRTGNYLVIQNARIGSSTVENNITVANNTLYEFDINGTSTYTVNGTTHNMTYRAASTQNTGKLRIWSSELKSMFYYLQIYKGGNLELDLIPVRIGSIGYIYDRVSHTLFENAGTGTVGLGPDV